MHYPTKSTGWNGKLLSRYTMSGSTTTVLKMKKEGNILFNNALNTFYLRLYGVRHMVTGHSASERGIPLTQHVLLLLLAARVLLYAPFQREDSTY